jgi:hypothetical protein
MVLSSREDFLFERGRQLQDFCRKALVDSCSDAGVSRYPACEQLLSRLHASLFPSPFCLGCGLGALASLSGKKRLLDPSSGVFCTLTDAAKGP